MKNAPALLSPAGRVVTPVPELAFKVGIAVSRVARVRFSLLAVLVVITIVSVALGWWYRRQTHVATALLQINYLESANNAESRFDIFCEAQRSLIESDVVIGTALSRGDVRQLGCIAGRINAAEWLRNELEVTFPGDSEIMQISLSGREKDMPDYCRLIDSIIECYESEILHRERVERQTNREARTTAAAKLSDDLAQKVEELNALISARSDDKGSESAEVVMMRAEIDALTDAWKALRTQILQDHLYEAELRSQIRLLQPATAVVR